MIRKKIAVIGLGSFGKVLVDRLFLEGHEVLAIDNSQEQVEEVKDYATASVCLDATDEMAMRSQGLDEMDIVVISVAENFETLVIAADILKKIGVKEIYARHKTALQKRVLNLIGVDQVFNPEEKAATNMAEKLRHDDILSNLFLSKEYRIVEVKVPTSLVGTTLGESQTREKYNLNIITIKRMIRNPLQKRKQDSEEEILLGIPDLNEKFRATDILMLFGKQSDINRFLES
ncbi:potassium channel family protein [Leptospira sp. GIMC2001]|uniref:potassium channel family protein n=1 Tax=Leptospira sp. GIMC2001 TaxID=1513297 RepID=UPI00234A26E3|nr:TrkA family potassium uptake protein [Leptospira sp. GIMC2001]WCL50146.1 TrkA family potassium uptake protein [Leptospira sp. GIMC2001]